MNKGIVENKIDEIVAYCNKTTRLINAALLVVLVVSAIHLFSWATYVANSIAFPTLIINAAGLVIISSYFWYLANKPQFLILSINEKVVRSSAANWLSRRDITTYAMYGLFTLCISFLTYLVVFFGWALYIEHNDLIISDFFKAMAILGFFFIALILSFFLGYQASRDIAPIYESVEEPLLHKFVKSGLVILPTKVALGSSHNIIFRYAFSPSCVLQLHKKPNEASKEYVEAELQAAAIKVDGEKKLRLCGTSPLPISTWNCQFQERGTQMLSLTLREVDAAAETQNVVFAFEHSVKIRGRLTASVEPVVAIMTSMLALWASISETMGGVLKLFP